MQAASHSVRVTTGSNRSSGATARERTRSGAWPRETPQRYGLASFGVMDDEFGLSELEGDERAVPVLNEPRWQPDERNERLFHWMHPPIVSCGPGTRPAHPCRHEPRCCHSSR